ncbi:MAG TPA: prepilin-type N-terminal cleavage/methylation domain-containing protein [Candidatus Atribacteria bacterium]|nr:prepilin-type N-terminal cleavage/methylation domain-containing protein [Candidatus Atribacteria bacterium]
MKLHNTEYRIQNTEYNHSRSARKGFTLMELLIVVGITTILAGVGVSSYITQQRVKLLNTTAQEIVGYLRYAQQKSIAQEEGSQWGVHFENPADGRDFYALYTGATYTTPVETKYLPTGIVFQTPSSGNSIDMSYEKLTGLLSGSSYKQIILQNTIGLTKNVLTCQQGLISQGQDISICSAVVDDTPPVISNVIASNVSYGSYVDSPFDLSADISEEQGGLLSCEYTINDGTDWYLATIEGFGPSYTCIKTGITSADGTSLTLNMRATSGGGTGTGTPITRTVDAIGPTCSDNWTDNWTANSPVNITITSNDAKSGVASTKYCVDTSDSCYPSTSGTSVSVSCASGSTCTQYARYAAWDNVNNVSSVYSKRVRQDKQAPTDGTLTAEPGNAQVSISWTVASDSGSGLATSDTYKLVFSTSSSPTINCTSDTQIYTGTSTSYLHSGLTNDITYYYRVCAKDAVNNMSTGSTASSTPHLLANGELCSLGSDCASGYCYVDEDGDRYAPASGTKRCQPLSQLSGVDCCDSDSRAYPGESTYYTSTNNCGSWDYDCSGTTNKSDDCNTRSTTLSSPNSCYRYVTCTGSFTGYVGCTYNTGTTSCGNSHWYETCNSFTCYGYNVDNECVAGTPTVYTSSTVTKVCSCK